MKHAAVVSVVYLLLTTVSTPPGFAQQQVGIPFEEQTGFVLEIEPPYDSIVIDLGSNPLSRDTAVELELPQNAQTLGPQGQAVDVSALRSGIEVSIRGQKLGSRLKIDRLQVLDTLGDDKTKVMGVYEKFDGQVATVGGQLVVLDEGARVEGVKQWEGMGFPSFDAMMLGSFVELKGHRGEDGLFHASQGETWPNVYTEVDQEVRATFRQNMTLPTRNQLAGGKVQIAGQEYRLVEDLELQAYVTRVGYELIPDYLEDLPDSDPAKILFRFYVIDDPSFNAFAYPDGSVFVHTGLLAVMENEAQLAAVLGHEIAHVTHEHGRRQFQRGKKVETGKKAAKLAGKAMKMLGKANPFKKKKKILGREVGLEDAIDFGTGLFSNVFGRKMENQADRVGLFYMHEAGYDPREAPKIWGKIVDLTGPEGRLEQIQAQVENALYSSHPAAQRRLSHLNREIALQWHDTDFSQAVVGEESYRETMGDLRVGR